MGPRPPSVKWPTKQKRNMSAVSSPAARTTTPSAKKTRPDNKVASLEAAVLALGPHAEPALLQSLQDAITKAKEGKQSRSPDEALDAAKAKVVSLEASIQALGDADPATLKVLQANAPVGVRLDSCAKYVERKKRLLAKCDEDMAKLQTLRASVEEELKAGVARLESLRAEAAVPMPQPQVPNPNVEADVSRMQQVIDELQRELSQWRAGARSHMDEELEEVEDAVDKKRSRKFAPRTPLAISGGAPSTPS